MDPSTRRHFLKNSAAAGLALASGPVFVFGQDAGSAPPPASQPDETAQTKPAIGKDLRVAYIGTGGIGGWHIEKTTELGVQCPCYCDVDVNQMERAAKAFPKAQRYQDYREMFDREHKNFDAVMIGIPDHHHYPATMIALALDKHCYTQKPLTHSVWEARRLREEAARHKVATQMGNQGHAGEGWRLLVEWIRSGAIGDVTEVHSWTDRPIWPQGIERPEGEDAVPSNLNWDVWIGPAPLRPYKNGVYHRFAWRGWWDFGCGALGDMACHIMDGMFWALEPGHPTSVEPIAMTPMNNETFPKASIVRWQFPAQGARKAFTAFWYDGELMPPLPPELEAGRKLASGGNLFVGTKATILVSGDYGNSPRIIPEARMKEIGKPPTMYERSPGQVDEFVLAATGQQPLDYPKSNFNYAGPMSETILLGNIALRMGRRLEWDGSKMAFTNNDEANQYLRREYREGWKF